jgi:hypothetical protein
MAQQNDEQIYVAVVGASGCSKRRPLEWYYEPVQNKARILLAARDQDGRAAIDGVGHIAPIEWPYEGGDGSITVLVYSVDYANGLR